MKQRAFGKNTKGEAATLYTFKNSNGMVMEVTDFGATMYALWIPTAAGKLDVVLGYDDPIGYEGPSGTFFGATVGRNANRLKDACFVIDGKTWTLGVNDNSNNLHSGPDCFHLRMWKVLAHTDDSIKLELNSPHGDQGFPGNAVIRMTYALESDNGLHIRYDAVAD